MKSCAIVDEYRGGLILGYLFYYEKEGAYSMELSEEVGREDLPIFLQCLRDLGSLSVGPEWSRRWVESRVIPHDRQNLGQILRENDLKEYDTFKLLMLAEGRCAQDDCAVKPVRPERLPDWVMARRKRKLEFFVPMRGRDVVLLFRDGTIWRTDLAPLMGEDEKLRRVAEREELFREARMLPGGTGITWGDGLSLTAEQLYGQGTRFPMEREELEVMTRAYAVDTAEVCRELDCSRQYVSQIVKANQLSVLKESGNTKLYARGDVERLKE